MGFPLRPTAGGRQPYRRISQEDIAARVVVRQPESGPLGRAGFQAVSSRSEGAAQVRGDLAQPLPEGFQCGADREALQQAAEGAFERLELAPRSLPEERAQVGLID